MMTKRREAATASSPGRKAGGVTTKTCPEPRSGGTELRGVCRRVAAVFHTTTLAPALRPGLLAVAASRQALASHRLKVFLLVAVFAALLIPAAAQRRNDRGYFGTPPPPPPRAGAPVISSSQTAGEFTFVRAIYSSPNSPYNRGMGGSWTVDYPEADNHFITGMREWAGTNLNIASRPEALEILDDKLFDYPFIYFVEPGFMELSDEEAVRLREYLMRGGFFFLDDFWGESEWRNVQEQLKKVLPDHEIKELPMTHPILHSYLDIEEVVQVPNIYNGQRGVTSEKGGIVPYYMGIEDKHGRLLVFISRNSDLGDAWEWINDSRYPVKYGLAAYKIGINVVIYAMSH